jgi:hypothetical protein
MNGDINMRLKYVKALETQSGTEVLSPGALPCPYAGHNVRMFQSVDELYDHAKTEHALQLASFEPWQARERLRDAALKLR